MRSLFKNTFKTISTLVILMTALSYISPYVNPSTFSWLSFLGTTFPWWLLFNVVFMLFWLGRMNRFGIYHLIIIALGWSYCTKFVGLQLGKPYLPEKSITIVTHNLGLMFYNSKATPAQTDSLAAAYANFLNKNGKPDILCTQETRGSFYPLLGNYLGYDQRFNLKKGTVIMSKYPIKAGGDIPFGKTSNSTLWADILLPDQRIVRVYNVHLQSNRVTKDAEKVIQDDQSWEGLSKVMSKVGGATSRRSEQAQRLRQHILDCPYPVIVCGDFNDTPNSYVYHHIADGLTDTFEARGFGLGTTFAGTLPLLRIDYILSDPGFPAHDSKVVHDSKWSDHYPVWAVLGL
jgi:endonuclease/exonuclease/phosphatase family metal-dependent hydrolase